MRTWRTGACAGVLAATLALGARPTRAWAQTPATAPDTQNATFAGARAAFERGLAALAAQRFGEAIPEFEASYRLRAAPVVQFNLGIALRGVGRYVEAIAAFERYLTSADASLGPAQRGAVEREVLEMQRQLGTVSLRVEPADATIVVDGRPRAARRLTLDPGEHVLEALADGFVTRRISVALGPGVERAVALRLEPQGAARSAAAPATPTPSAGRGVAISPLVWFGLGAVLLGAGGGAGLGLYGDAQFDALQARCDMARCVSTDASYRADESQLGTLALGVYALWAVAGVGAVVTTIGAVLTARGAPATSAHAARRSPRFERIGLAW